MWVNFTLDTIFLSYADVRMVGPLTDAGGATWTLGWLTSESPEDTRKIEQLAIWGRWPLAVRATSIPKYCRDTRQLQNRSVL
jgi:hypothetical protein